MEVRVGKEAMERITERLSVMEGLYFPHAVPSNVATVSQHKFLLLHLLSRDVAIFLAYQNGVSVMRISTVISLVAAACALSYNNYSNHLFMVTRVMRFSCLPFLALPKTVNFTKCLKCFSCIICGLNSTVCLVYCIWGANLLLSPLCICF
uniref:Coiled-coil domain-containing protein 97 n=2 Tax=Rhizophora mucronata TaxID=61149 RepID=A0A2P2K687_RHIMU